MGLDMYLSATIHTVDREWATPKEVKLNKGVRKLCPEMFDSGNLGTVEIAFEVGYWRKANAIHKWFVETCQDGDDNCKKHPVSRDDLKVLKIECELILNAKTPEMAEEKLPVGEGFFFGSYEYDEWYWGAIEETIEIINKCLELSEEWSFEYQSSW